MSYRLLGESVGLTWVDHWSKMLLILAKTGMIVLYLQ